MNFLRVVCVLAVLAAAHTSMSAEDVVPTPTPVHADPPMPAVQAANPAAASQMDLGMYAPICCGPTWCVDLGVTWLQRDMSNNAILLTDPANADAQVLGTNDADLGWAAGPMLTVTYNCCDCSALEFRWFQVDDFDGAASMPDTGTDYENPLAGAGVFFRTADVRYESDLTSFEMNRRYNCGRYSLLYGFRYIDLDESSNFVATGPAANGTININTENRMYGLQAGIDGYLARGCNWGVNGYAKGGGYLNAASHFCDTTGDFGVAVIDNDDIDLAFVGEIGIRGEYCWSDCVTFVAGYEALFLGFVNDGLSTAPDKIKKLPTGITEVEGDNAFYHGGYIGLRCCF